MSKNELKPGQIVYNSSVRMKKTDYETGMQYEAKVSLMRYEPPLPNSPFPVCSHVGTITLEFDSLREIEPLLSQMSLRMASVLTKETEALNARIQLCEKFQAGELDEDGLATGLLYTGLSPDMAWMKVAAESTRAKKIKVATPEEANRIVAASR